MYPRRAHSFRRCQLRKPPYFPPPPTLAPLAAAAAPRAISPPVAPLGVSAHLALRAIPPV